MILPRQSIVLAEINSSLLVMEELGGIMMNGVPVAKNLPGLRPLGFWRWDPHHDTPSAFPNNVPITCVAYTMFDFSFYFEQSKLLISWGKYCTTIYPYTTLRVLTVMEKNETEEDFGGIVSGGRRQGGARSGGGGAGHVQGGDQAGGCHRCQDQEPSSGASWSLQHWASEQLG